MARASLKPRVRGTLHTSTGSHKGDRVPVVAEIESENWYREQVQTGGSFASDRKYQDFDRMMRSNRAAGL